MASFDFVVDTNPMATEISRVSHKVDNVSGAVIAMQTAVVAAEQEGADYVCENVNKGFYSLMHSQITQKIAKLTSIVEAKLLELGQYASALRGIKARMENDYHMISFRYTKLFKSINSMLASRIAELDMPVFKLVDRDMRVLENRLNINSAIFGTQQLESVLSTQLLVVSKVKMDAESTLSAISKYIRETNAARTKANASMECVKIDGVEDIFIPVSIVESTSSIGAPAVSYYVARSGNADIDRSIDNSVRECSVTSVLKGNWVEGDADDLSRVELEFSRIVENCELEERLKNEIARLFENVKDIKRLDTVGYEL